MRVLLVEDDARLGAEIRHALQSDGYVVELVKGGEEAWYRGDTEDFSAVILDLGLPVMDGLSVLRQWRANGRKVPVLILTARGSWIERVEGIDAGADDYIAKPFRIEELLARLRAVLRRSVGQVTSVVSLGDVILDDRRKTVTRRGAPISLSMLEYRLVSYMIQNQDRVVPSHELEENVYGINESHDSNALEVLIGRVRKKLGADFISTRRGFGYIANGGQRDD